MTNENDNTRKSKNISRPANSQLEDYDVKRDPKTEVKTDPNPAPLPPVNIIGTTIHGEILGRVEGEGIKHVLPVGGHWKDGVKFSKWLCLLFKSLSLHGKHATRFGGEGAMIWVDPNVGDTVVFLPEGTLQSFDVSLAEQFSVLWYYRINTCCYSTDIEPHLSDPEWLARSLQVRRDTFTEWTSLKEMLEYLIN